jgi:thioredoxin 1
MDILHLTKDDFENETASGVVLVDFWAGWCMPCKMLAPVIEEIAEEYGGTVKVAKVDVDAEGELAAEFGVMSIPTVVLMKDGVETKRFVGVQPTEVYTAALPQPAEAADAEDRNLSVEQ